MSDIAQKIYELKLAINKEGGQLFSIECSPQVRQWLTHKTDLIENNYSRTMRPFETVFGVRLVTNDWMIKNSELLFEPDNKDKP